jgi:predicted Zn-dependent peptidase
MTKLFDEDISTLKLFSKLLSSGLESPLYKIAREKYGLCYSIDSDVIQFDNKAAIMIDTETTKKNEKKLIQVIEETIKKAEKHIDKNRFQIIKENLITQKKKQQINRYLHVDDEINGEARSILYNIENTRIDKIIKLIKEINGNDWIISSN